MSCQLSISLHGVKGTHWRSIVNCLFVSMVSRVLIGGVLSIVYLSPWCQGYSLEDYCLFVSMVSLIYPLEVSSQLSICLHGVKGTPWRSIVNCLFVSMVSRVLIGGVLSIVYLPLWSH